MITRPVARWIAFGICLTIMIASFFMTSAVSKPVVNDPVAGQDEIGYKISRDKSLTSD